MGTVSSDKSICQRLRRLREDYAGKRGKSFFAKALGLSPSTYSYYEHSRIPPAEVLCRVCELTGADLRWLLTGDGALVSGSTLAGGLNEKVSALLAAKPEALAPLTAFVDLLSEQRRFEGSGLGGESAGGSRCRWVPVLGRTAAGLVHFWSDWGERPPQVTELGDLIARHQAEDLLGSRRQMMVGDGVVGGAGSLGRGSVCLVQLSEPDREGLCEFLEAAEVSERYADAFALRVDGESMSPRISDGDIVVLSPSVAARNGVAAVVQLRGQMGVTCKIYRVENGEVHLIPANERFSSCVFEESEVVWALAVLWVIRLK